MLDRLFTRSTEFEPAHLARELQQFARDIHALLECFDQFPEFIDEVPDRAFSKDSEVRSFPHMRIHFHKRLLIRTGLFLWTTSEVGFVVLGMQMRLNCSFV